MHYQQQQNRELERAPLKDENLFPIEGKNCKTDKQHC